MKNVQLYAELQEIAAQNQGILRCADVVSAAEPQESPLHARFEWDDGRAGHLYRLEQARTLIQECSITTPQAPTLCVPAFISLAADRSLPGGGYRAIEDVMTDKERRAQMLEEALGELKALQSRYGHLNELAQVWSATARAKKRSRKAA
jgi:hypothetical protein